jgi:phage terminase large subunit-like protein
VQPLLPGDYRPVVLGADASTTRDCTALVGCAYDDLTKKVEVVYCRVWQPKKGLLRGGKPTVDLDETIGMEILRLAKTGWVESCYYDPYQLHAVALALEKNNVRMVEFPQTNARIAADQALYDAIIGRAIAHPNHPDLSEHVTNAIAVETARGYRLAKEKTKKKIDAAVSLSMAHYGAVNELKRYAGRAHAGIYV